MEKCFHFYLYFVFLDRFVNEENGKFIMIDIFLGSHGFFFGCRLLPLHRDILYQNVGQNNKQKKGEKEEKEKKPWVFVFKNKNQFSMVSLKVALFCI